MYLNMKDEQLNSFKKIEKKIKLFYEKCDKFVHISEVQFPQVKKVADIACSEGQRVNKALHVEIIRKTQMHRLR